MRFWTVILALALMLSCETEKNKLQRALVELQGKEFVFPSDTDVELYSNVAGQDKDSLSKIMMASKAKILVYVDSTGCSSCKLNIYDWMLKMAEIGRLVPDPQDVSLLVYFWLPKQAKFHIRQSLAQADFRYPVFFDPTNSIARLNNLPGNELFHVLLLDNDNKIMLIGSPQGNAKMWDLYKDQIAELCQ